MKKYVNGKLIEMTEEEIAKAKSRRNVNKQNYNTRIQELEEKIVELENKLNSTKE